jgi:hypothetical protein
MEQHSEPQEKLCAHRGVSRKSACGTRGTEVSGLFERAFLMQAIETPAISPALFQENFMADQNQGDRNQGGEKSREPGGGIDRERGRQIPNESGSQGNQTPGGGAPMRDDRASDQNRQQGDDRGGNRSGSQADQPLELEVEEQPNLNDSF